MRSAAGPSAEAISIFVDENGADLLRFFQRRLETRESAPDLLAILLLRIWEKQRSLPRDPTEWRLWAFGMARNVLRENARRKVAEVRIADRLRDHMRELPPIPPDDPADLLERQALSQGVHEALQTLEATSREIVMLVHWEDLSLADVARLLKINESTARTKYGRARTKLRDELKARDLLGRNEDQLPHGSERHA
jgi:RNA polymerase sigma-70 factor (ECF subfamily)